MAESNAAVAPEPAVPAATSGAAPVAVAPALPRIPASESDDPAALKAKLELVKQDNLAKGETNQKLNQQLSELQKQFAELQATVQGGKLKQLEDQGEYKLLVQELRATIEAKDTEILELRQQVANMQSAVAQERLKVSTLGTVAKAGPVDPNQLYALLQPQIRESEKTGKPVVLNGGVEVPLEAHLETLKKPGSGWEHHFLPPGTRGIGIASPSAAANSNGNAFSNPWAAESLNLTGQLLLEMQNPQLAEQLKAEAGYQG